MQEIENSAPVGIDTDNLDASLANAKVRFATPDLAVTPALDPVVSEQARELQQLRAQLFDAERTALRAQKAASDYREQVSEAQADIANMKSRWYAAEKARNAVSSQREVDTSGLSTQVLRLQRELERTQYLASSDMERAAARIRTLEERLENALSNAAVAESSQNQYRKRSNRSLWAGISIAAILAAVLAFEKLPHRAEAASSAVGEPATNAARPASAGSRRLTPAYPLQALSQRPFVPKAPTKNLPDALGSLDKALKALPGLEPADVIEQVRKRQSTPQRPVCQFDWADGGPSMVFDQSVKGRSTESWALAISGCADAVNQAH